jgi:hypothetical protein
MEIDGGGGWDGWIMMLWHVTGLIGKGITVHKESKET